LAQPSSDKWLKIRNYLLKSCKLQLQAGKGFNGIVKSLFSIVSSGGGIEGYSLTPGGGKALV
jgi:hypothetical protein